MEENKELDLSIRFQLFEKDEQEGRVKLTPGEILKHEMQLREIKTTQLARLAGVPRETILNIYQSKRKIDAAIAIKLEGIIGIQAHWWLLLQADYDLYIERLKQ